MKTLLILRHAKSSWEKPDLSDFDRPLNPRGLTAAPLMGNIIYNKNLQPDLIISSPAKRAKQTAILIRETAQIKAEIKYEEKVYEASPITLMHVVSEIDDRNDTILIVGHNPGIEGFIKFLTGEERSMPTAGLAQIDLNIDSWEEITQNCGKLDYLIRPRDEMKDLRIF